MRILIFTLLTAILLQVCGRSWVVVYYEFNKAYIAKNLCENRDKPELKCHGKCKLMKLLEKERQKEKFPLGNVFEKSADILCEKPQFQIISVSCCLAPLQKVKSLFAYSSILSQGPFDNFLHPPAS